MEKHAIFLDIDGTLTYGQHIVSQRNLKAIAAARQKGHLVFINTGRSWGNIPDVLFETLEVDGWLAGNGSHIVIGGKELMRQYMSRELVIRVAEFVLARDEMWCIFEGDERVFFVPSLRRSSIEDKEVIDSLPKARAALEKHRIEVIAAGPSLPPEFFGAFKDEIDVFMFTNYCDCVAKGCSKANAIEAALAETGVKRKNTIAVGDSANDIPMFKSVQIGVAVANAQPEVLAVADDVTCTNEESGVAMVIEKYLL